MEIRCETSLLTTLESLARAAAPAEACGLLAGERNLHGWRLTEFIEMKNQSTELGKFSMDPVEVLRAGAGIEVQGQQLCACFHSHPGGSANLSADDLEFAWPELIQLICAADGEQVAVFSAWRVSGGIVQRLPILTGPA